MEESTYKVGDIVAIQTPGSYYQFARILECTNVAPIKIEGATSEAYWKYKVLILNETPNNTIGIYAWNIKRLATEEEIVRLIVEQLKKELPSGI